MPKYERRDRQQRNKLRERQAHSIPQWCVVRFQPEFTTSSRTVIDKKTQEEYAVANVKLPAVPRTSLRSLVPGIEDLIVTAALRSAWWDTDIFAAGEVDWFVQTWRKHKLGDTNPARVINLYIWKARDPLSIIQTAAHELRHVAQMQRGEYYDPDPDPTTNWEEPLEVDARTFADQIVNDVASRWKRARCGYDVQHFRRIDRTIRGEWVVKQGLSGRIMRGARFTSYEDALACLRGGKHWNEEGQWIPLT